MNRLVVLLFILLLMPLLRPVSTNAHDDDYIPTDDDRGFDVLHYDLDLEIDPDAATVAGTVIVRLRRLVDDLDVLRLDLVEEMIVSDLRLVAADSLLAFTHAGDSLLVALPVAAAGTETEIAITWSGRPQRHGLLNAGLLFRLDDAGTPDPSDDVPTAFSVSQTWSAHSWWPCKDHPSDKATARIAVTAPKNLVAISNGRLDAVEFPRPGWHRSVWSESHPIATYLVAVAIADYQSWHESCPCAAGPLPLTFYAFTQDLADAKADLASTCEMMRFLEERCGPYPFSEEKYATVEIRWGAAMENQTMTGIAQFNLTGTGQFENIVLHEMAHSWFGNALTPATWSDIWLSEGFATYFEALWFEEQQGSDYFLEYMSRMGPGHPTHDLFLGAGILADPAPILPNRLVYDKGAWVLHMLRGLIGDTAFLDFVHDYATDPRLLHATVSVDDLIAAASTAAGRDLAAFFTPWLTTDLVPEIDVVLEQDPIGGRVKVAVTQLQEPLFLFALPLRLKTALGDHDFTVEISERHTTFSLPLEATVFGLQIDPLGWLMYRTGRLAPPLLASAPPTPNPATAAGTTLHFRLRDTREVRFAVYDLRGRRLAGRDLGSYAASDPGDASGSSWHWDCRGDDGRLLPAGVYWIEVLTSDRRAVHKITLVH